jgi:hypothetical protein
MVYSFIRKIISFMWQAIDPNDVSRPPAMMEAATTYDDDFTIPSVNTRR